MRDADNGAFRIGDWRVESRLNRLSQGEKAIRVEPKIMQVLVCLAERPGRVYSKDELISTVWKDSVVTEDVLARAISELRRAFGDDPRSPSYIETIHKTGYRLIAAVGPDQSGVGVRGARATGRIWFWGVSATVAVLALAWLIRGQEPPAESPNWQLRPATSLSGLEVRPSLSPDGKAFVFTRSEQDGSSADIFLKRIGDAAPVQLTDDPAQDGGATWSPDGEKIAFLRYTGERCAIMIHTVADSTTRELNSCHNVTYPDLRWSHDGSWLAYNDRLDGDVCHSIFRLEAATGIQSKLTNPDPSDWGDYDPVFSAADNAVFFARAKSEAIQDLYRVDIETGLETQLTFDGRNIYGIDLSADGAAVVYSSNRGGQRYELWQLPVDGGEPSVFLSGAADFVNPSVGSDGDMLLFEQRSYDFNLWMADLENGTAGAPFSPSSRWEMYPAISNDGKRVAFSSNRSGSYEIWVADIDGANLVQLTSFDAPLTASPKWSPTDDELVFVSRPDGNADLFVIGSDGADKAIRLTETVHDELAPSWSADGQALYYASNQTGEWQIWKASRDGGEAAQVTKNGGFSAQESQDGRDLYFARNQEAGIWRISPDGGEATRIATNPGSGDWGNWGIVDEGLYLMSRDGKDRIELLDLDGVHLATLFEPPRNTPPGEISLALSRDGKTLLYVQVDMRLADIIQATNAP